MTKHHGRQKEVGWAIRWAGLVHPARMIRLVEQQSRLVALSGASKWGYKRLKEHSPVSEKDINHDQRRPDILGFLSVS